MIIGLVIAAVIMAIALININKLTESKTCAYGDCPQETSYGHTYCYTHKCANLSCDNVKPYSGSYCDECIEKGKNK